MSKIITIGEPMALFIAQEEGPLENVTQFERSVAGAEINFSIGMSRLGHQTTYITKLGKDPFGKTIENFLVENSIDISYVTYEENHLTGMQWKQKVEKLDPEVFSARKNSAASTMDVDTIEKIDWDGVEHVHVTGIPPALSRGCRNMVFKLMNEARKRKVRISFDPNLRPGLWNEESEMVQVINELASLADIVFPGVAEGEILTGSEDLQDIVVFYHNLGVETVVVKLGEKGAFTSTEGAQFFTSGFAVEQVVDTVGAGDGFAVGVVSGILENLPLEDAVLRGTAIGALVVTSSGDNEGLPDRHELQKFISSQMINPSV
ncbi:MULTISPECIES: sugar kinase [unclassified Exiguobacterium]|uniref:sugar kinase n=1 Tax=unclassified Exiguobacterium TaxID=2644629 RepID=UPI001BE841D0|nr:MULTISPECIES: sugar kinase [unclassified Exiguobacterium]